MSNIIYLTRPSNKYGFGGQWQIGGKKLSNEAGSGLNMAIGAGSGILGSALSGGYDSNGVGSTMRSLGNAASAIPGPWGAALGAGLNLVGGFVDRAFGVKWNQENINKVQGNINALKGFSSNAGTWDSLQSNIETMPAQMTFDNSFIGKNGWFNHKADRRAEKMRSEQSQAFNYAQNAITNNASNIASSQAQTLARNYVANGGPIQILGNGVMSPFGARYAKGGVLKNPLSSNGMDWNIGLTSINNGGSHERNPYEGVQVGVDQQGTPNLVEEGEVIWNDYVFSNRMKVPKKLREQLKLGKNDMTYAEAVNSKKKEREERPNDPIEKRGFEAFLTRLGTSQEEQRQKAEARKARKEAQRIAQEQAVMQGLGVQPSPMYDEQQGIPMEQSIPQNQQPIEGQYAHGGKLGNWFDGWGDYINSLYGNGFGQLANPWNQPQEPDDETKILRNISEIDDLQYLNNLKTRLNTPGFNSRNNTQAVRFALDQRIEQLNNQNNPIYKYRDLKPGLGIPTWSSIQTPQPTNVSSPARVNRERTNNWNNFENNLTLGKAVKSKASPLDAPVSNWLQTLYKNNTNYGDYNRLLDYIYGQGKAPIQYTSNPNKLIEDAGAANNANLRNSIMEAYGQPVLGTDKKPVTYTDANGNEATNYNIGAFRQNILNNNIPTTSDSINSIVDTSNLTKDKLKLTGVNPVTVGDNTESGGSNWLANLRYIPALGNAISVFTDLMGWTNKPDYTNANAVLEASRGVRDVRFNPIGDYLTYRPLDRMFYQNQLNAQAGATQRNIINTAGNRGAAMAGLLASGYNAMNSQGNLARQSEEFNENQRQQVAQFNRETNRFNSQMDLEAQRANLGASEVRMNAALNAARLRDAVDARVGAARSANLTNLFDSIGDIGREEFTRNMINSNRAQYYTIDRMGGIHYKPGYYALSDWEKRYQEDMARRDSRAIQGNTRRGYPYSYGGYLTIKRRR